MSIKFSFEPVFDGDACEVDCPMFKFIGNCGYCGYSKKFLLTEKDITKYKKLKYTIYKRTEICIQHQKDAEAGL